MLDNTTIDFDTLIVPNSIALATIATIDYTPDSNLCTLYDTIDYYYSTTISLPQLSSLIIQLQAIEEQMQANTKS